MMWNLLSACIFPHYWWDVRKYFYLSLLENNYRSNYTGHIPMTQPPHTLCGEQRNWYELHKGYRSKRFCQVYIKIHYRYALHRNSFRFIVHSRLWTIKMILCTSLRRVSWHYWRTGVEYHHLLQSDGQRHEPAHSSPTSRLWRFNNVLVL